MGQWSVRGRRGKLVHRTPRHSELRLAPTQIDVFDSLNALGIYHCGVKFTSHGLEPMHRENAPTGLAPIIIRLMVGKWESASRQLLAIHTSCLGKTEFLGSGTERELTGPK
jgi:hypothetical protein